MPSFQRLSKIVHVFCEGDTEYHYFDLYKQMTHLGFSLKPVDVHGGGYSNMLDKIKKSSPFGILARVVLLDFDRYLSISSEKIVFDKLVEYMNNQNKKGMPFFFIVSNPDFDDFVLLHDMNYNFNNKQTVLNTNGYQTINDLKGDKNVYKNFNKGNKKYQNALTGFNPRHVVDNDFKYDKTKIVFRNHIITNMSNQNIRTSNIIDLFRVIACLV